MSEQLVETVWTGLAFLGYMSAVMLMGFAMSLLMAITGRVRRGTAEDPEKVRLLQNEVDTLNAECVALRKRCEASEKSAEWQREMVLNAMSVRYEVSVLEEYATSLERAISDSRKVQHIKDNIKAHHERLLEFVDGHDRRTKAASGS